MKTREAKPLPGFQRDSGTAVRPSRRHAQAAAVTMTPAISLAANSATVPNFAANGRSPYQNLREIPVPDPVFAAIEQHRQAVQARISETDDDNSEQLLEAENEAFITWLTTVPTTMAGAIATLKHASRRPYKDADYANLAKSAQYSHGRGSPCDAGEQFPAMIATALHQIMACDLGRECRRSDRQFP
jgi:hypothetical protein